MAGACVLPDAQPFSSGHQRLAVMLRSALTMPGEFEIKDMRTTELANERPGVNAGWRLLFSFERRWPGTTQAERWATRARMKRLSILLPLACCLLVVGCEKKPASVPPVIESVANAQKLADGAYEVQLRY